MNHVSSISIVFVFVLVLITLTGCEKKDVGAVSSSPLPAASATSTREELRQAAQAATSAVAANTLNKKKVIDLHSIAFRAHGSRRMVSDFYATNLGLPNVKGGVPLPDQIEVSFDVNMAGFWQKKVTREDVSDSTLGKTPEILERYLKNPRGFTTLSTFVKDTDRVVQQAKQSLDWKRVCIRYKLSKEKCAVLQEVTGLLQGKDFVAYGMTELLPNDGRFNVKYLDMLLRNAGTSYLMHFPAMHDNMLSLGLYQFTSFALRKDEEETEGASIVNGFVKEGGLKIPDSVAYLVGNDHHVAAVYFAVHNLAKMLHRLDDKSIKSFAKRHKDFQDEMVMFIACAHHLPASAWKATASWIKSGMKSSLEKASNSMHSKRMRT